MAALIGGQRDPKVRAQMARARMLAKIPQLVEAFGGRFSDHHGFRLTPMLARIDALTIDIDAVQERTEPRTGPFRPAGGRLDEIPGIGPTAAAVIIAEIGVDMTRFPTPAHLSSWAKFAPGVKGVGRAQEGQRRHRARQPLPGKGPGRTVPPDRPRARQETSHRRGRPIHPGHRLAPAGRRQRPVTRRRTRLLRLTSQSQPQNA